MEVVWVRQAVSGSDPGALPTHTWPVSRLSKKGAEKSAVWDFGIDFDHQGESVAGAEGREERGGCWRRREGAVSERRRARASPAWQTRCGPPGAKPHLPGATPTRAHPRAQAHTRTWRPAAERWEPRSPARPRPRASPSPGAADGPHAGLGPGAAANTGPPDHALDASGLNRAGTQDHKCRPALQSPPPGVAMAVKNVKGMQVSTCKMVTVPPPGPPPPPHFLGSLIWDRMTGIACQQRLAEKARPSRVGPKVGCSRAR
ncbi:uncharacterized protein LOC141511844 [Macrotis lagotis]|uniref:uncharacterized protein LOC141511844 n=1 Tax=Macrotis lagotis TaxID=92651 RepID=UPI003D6816F3